MRLSVLVLLSFSLQAVAACPDLSGIYKNCRSLTDQNPVAQITVEQKIVNKITNYTFSTQEIEVESIRVEKYIADGKTKIVSDTDADTGITIKTETLTSCVNNVLNIKMNATLDSEAFANITIKATKVGTKLTQVFSGVSMGEAVNDTIVCE